MAPNLLLPKYSISKARELKPILVVDDEPVLRESLRDWLYNAG